jgi:hypothetical protein
MRALLLSALLAAASLHADTKTLYDFEGSTQGFSGKTAVGTIGVTSGKSSLEIDTTGSSGWNQNLAILANNEDWSDAVEFQADITLPKGTHDGAGYLQFIPVFSGPLDPFYQAGKVELKDGLNHVVVKVNGAKKIGTPWKLQLVFNSGKAVPGKVYIDNIAMHKPGRPGSLRVKVQDASGQPVANAMVAAGTAAIKTGTDGVAELKLPGDPYSGEVLGTDIQGQTFKADVPSGKSAEQVVTVQRIPKLAPVPVKAWVQAEKPGIVFDAHRIYGHNMAMWSGLDPFTNPEQIKKLHAIRAELIRIPGGEYGNQWDWRKGEIHKQDAAGGLDWSPEAKWSDWKKWLTDLGPQTEALMILNIFQQTPESNVEWIADARAAGIKVRYVELGNEPDLDPKKYLDGKQGGGTYVETYVKVAAEHARAVRKAFPDIKILGPVTAQIVDKECPGKNPWECNKYVNGEQADDPETPDYVQKFLQLYAKQGDLLDGLSFHSYPYWPGDVPVWDAAKAFATTKLFAKYMPRFKQWMKEAYGAKAARMEYAMTEYHIQVPETWVTADVESGVWHANYLMEFVKNGGTIATAWDMNTTKVGDGGGHGMLDPNNDPTRPYAERPKYWVFKMLANNFTGTLVPAQTNNPDVAVYAAKDRGRTSVLVVNRSPNKAAQVTIQASGTGAVKQIRQIQFSHNDYLWSKVLYRAVLNEDPTTKQKVFGAPAERSGWRVIAPVVPAMSVSVYVFE